MLSYVGVDVSKLTLDVAVLRETGELQRSRFENTLQGHQALRSWLQDIGQYQVIVEATGSYHQNLLVYFQTQHQSISVVNPRQVSAYANSLNRRNKTDAADALLLAYYGRERQPQSRLVNSSIQQSLAREIEALVEDITRLKNRLEAATEGIVHDEILASLKRRIKTLEEEKELLEKRLEQDLRLHHGQQLDLLQTIPGIGKRSACLLLAEIGNIHRFSSASALVAFAGLNPERFESGTSVRRHAPFHARGRLIYVTGFTCLLSLACALTHFLKPSINA